MRRPSPALVVSFIAVFLAATGGAVAGVQIGGKQIKDGSITGKDVKNDSLSGTDIKGDVRGPEGPRGARGAQGPAGPAGSAAAGVPVSYRFNSVDIPAGDELQGVYAVCPGGQVPVGGSHRIQDGLVLRFSDFGDSAGNPDSWMALVDNPTADPLQVSVTVACIRASSVDAVQ
jgi:hypothetical protein